MSIRPASALISASQVFVIVEKLYLDCEQLNYFWIVAASGFRQLRGGRPVRSAATEPDCVASDPSSPTPGVVDISGSGPPPSGLWPGDVASLGTSAQGTMRELSVCAALGTRPLPGGRSSGPCLQRWQRPGCSARELRPLFSSLHCACSCLQCSQALLGSLVVVRPESIFCLSQSCQV